MNDLRVGVYPLEIKWADKEVNLSKVETEIACLKDKVDIVVLPELFSTGFTADIDVLRELAEDDNGSTINRLKRLSANNRIAIAGSYLSTHNGMFYNRAFFLKPDGNESYYNKRHLFSLSAESRTFAPGTELPGVVDYMDWRIALIVCYDLRFPVWCRRSSGSCQYDVMLVPANWPVSRKYAWEHLLIARAIENQAIVVGADCSGQDEYGDYNDMTRVYNSMGFPVDSETIGSTLIYTLSKNELTELRRRWPVANDADSFCLI